MTNEVLVGRVYQINISNGGVPKWPVPSAWVTYLGIEGDRHRSPSHGGPERALCLFSLEVIRLLQAEGHPIEPGAVGGCFKDRDFSRILQTKFPGHSRMYARVLQEGEIVTGDPVSLVSRAAHPEE